MDKIIISIPFFVSVITFYIYFLLKKPKEKEHRFIPYILISIMLETAYLVYVYVVLSDFSHNNFILNPLHILSASMFFIFLYEIIEKRPLKWYYIILNLLPAFCLYATFYSIPYRALYTIKAALYLLYIIILAYINKKGKINDRKTSQLIGNLKILLMLITVSFALFFGLSLFFTTFVHTISYLFKILTISITVALYLYLLNAYKYKLEYEGKKRLENFNSLSRLSIMKEIKNGVVYKVAQSENGAKTASGRYGKSLLEAKVLKEYQEEITTFFKDEKNYYLGSDFNMQKLSRMTKIPAHHLSQVFSIAMKTSFNQYVNQKRIEYACELLRERKDMVSATELCDMCGYKARSSFYKQFKSVTGYTLAEYRELNKRKSTGTG